MISFKYLAPKSFIPAVEKCNNSVAHYNWPTASFTFIRLLCVVSGLHFGLSFIHRQATISTSAEYITPWDDMHRTLSQIQWLIYKKTLVNLPSPKSSRRRWVKIKCIRPCTTWDHFLKTIFVARAIILLTTIQVCIIYWWKLLGNIA